MKKVTVLATPSPENCGQKLPSEPERAYQAFCIYRDLGPGRSILKAYRAHAGEEKTATTGMWVAWSRNYNWLQRATEWDAEKDRKQSKFLQEIMDEAQYQRVFKDTICAARTFREAARIAYFDLRRVARWDNKDGLVFKNSEELTDEEVSAIKKIRTYTQRDGTQVIEIEAHDKMKALELLGRSQKLWEAEKSGDTTNNNYVLVVQAAQRGDYDPLLRRAFPTVALSPVETSPTVTATPDSLAEEPESDTP